MSSVSIVSRQLLELLKNKPKLKELVKEKKFNIDSLISDLKLEQGDRGKAEEVPKKKFDKNVSKQKDIPTPPEVPTKTSEPMSFAKGGKLKRKKTKKKTNNSRVIAKKYFKGTF